MTTSLSDEAIRELLLALPCTKDGIPVVPRSQVFYVDTCTVDSRIASAYVRSVSPDGWSDGLGQCPHFVRDGSQPYFSSRVLAMNHRAAILEKKAEKARREAQKEAQKGDD